MVSYEGADADLVGAFLTATSGYSTREAAELVGVSHGTVARWRNGEIGELMPATRRALEEYTQDVLVRNARAPDLVREEVAIGYLTPDEDDHAGGGGTLRDLQDLLRSETLLFQQLRVWGKPGKRSDDKRALIDLLVRVGEDLRREGHKLDLSHLSKAYAAILEGKL